MENEITIAEICRLLEWLIADLKKENLPPISAVSGRDFYLCVPDELIYQAQLTSIQPDVGSVSDDIQFLKSDLSAGRLSTRYVIVHLLEIVRLLVSW